MEIGWSLASEQHGPRELVSQATRAEEAGFSFLAISDHFHPWIDRQGHSPFVWGVIGGVATATDRIGLITAVTCPTTRIHPAIIAQAAATAGAMMPGRFILGVGSGENLNEHILGDRWPPTDLRQERLEEAIAVIRLLWEGATASHHGRHYTVENARIYTLPDPLPPIFVGASGPKSSELAGRLADGLISVGPNTAAVKGFRSAGGEGKPCYGELHACWDRDKGRAQEVLMDVWPISGLPGEMNQLLPTPAHYEQACSLVRPEDLSHVPTGPDPEPYISTAKSYEEAGFSHLFVRQVGPDIDGFMSFWRSEVAPELGRR